MIQSGMNFDEMSVSDMSSLISGGGYQTAAVDSIEKVSTTDNDGPANIYNNYTGAAGNAYPSEVMLANTWNKELAKAMGESIGKEADELDVSGWYAPGMNIHRSAFGGRNFEYYSEDSILSGYMAAAEIQGLINMVYIATLNILLLMIKRRTEFIRCVHGQMSSQSVRFILSHLKLQLRMEIPEQ